MNVLSLFDGMSCGHLAMDASFFEVEQYYASEINPHATKVSEANYPSIKRMGDVTQWLSWDIDYSTIDIVLAGFPCQAWSVAGKQLGDLDERGKLFWVMLEIIKHVKLHNPKVHFIIENVKMKGEFEEYITHHTTKALGEIHKTLINSALVSAQNRKRYYWTSFPVTQPNDEGVILADILLDNPPETLKVNKTPSRVKMWGNGVNGKCPNSEHILKSWALTTKVDRWNNAFLAPYGDFCRYPSPEEYEMLQTVPVGYTNHVSKTQRYAMLGNGWTIKVITHILNCLWEHNNHQQFLQDIGYYDA